LATRTMPAGEAEMDKEAKMRRVSVPMSNQPLAR
jgi:hypothetical protein